MTAWYQDPSIKVTSPDVEELRHQTGSPLACRAGVLPSDAELAAWLRGAAPKRLVLAANKCERRARDGSSGVEDMLTEATRLGLGEPVAISAETGQA